MSLRTTLDGIRLEHKRPLLAKIALLDGESKRIKAAIVELEEPIDAQIKAEEARKAAEKAERERLEQEAAERRRALISKVSMMPARVAGKASIEIAAAIDELTVISSDDSQQEAFGEMFPVWLDTVAETAARLRGMHTSALRQEDEAARIAAERAEEARRQQLEAERLAAERAALEAERKRMEEEARQARAAEEARLAKERAELEAQRQAIQREREAAAREAAERKAREEAELAAQAAAQRAAEVAAEEDAMKAVESGDAQVTEVVTLTALMQEYAGLPNPKAPTDAEITDAVAVAFGMTLMAAAERIGMFDAATEIARIRSTQ